jgi:hypothetical protein
MSVLPLRIAFDVDGVVADMNRALLHQAEMLFGTVLARPRSPLADSARSNLAQKDRSAADDAPVAGGLALTPRQQRKLWRQIARTENFWQNLDEIEPGAIRLLAAAAAAHRWEIIFLTKRPKTLGSTAQLQTQRWLAARGFDHPSVYVVQGSRGRVAAALGLDVVVDDTIENCFDVVVDSSATTVLVWRDAEHLLPAAAGRLGIRVVHTVEECIGALITRDSPAAVG